MELKNFQIEPIMNVLQKLGNFDFGDFKICYASYKCYTSMRVAYNDQTHVREILQRKYFVYANDSLVVNENGEPKFSENGKQEDYLKELEDILNIPVTFSFEKFLTVKSLEGSGITMAELQILEPLIIDF